MASVVVCYCSNEKAFIDALLTECYRFSDDIVVSYGSHLYDGTPEDKAHIDALRSKHNSVRFVEYVVDNSIDLNKQKGVVKRPKAYWHNLARYTGISSLKKEEWVFLIDSDEIPEGSKVLEWLSKTNLHKECIYKMANYWYFKSVNNQATSWEDSVLLVHSSCLSADNIFGDMERDHLVAASGCRLVRQVVGTDGNPMWHHYSFVRNKEGIVHKIKNWGHSDDSFNRVDATKFVDYIYKDENVNDIVHGYEYKKANNIFSLRV